MPSKPALIHRRLLTHDGHTAPLNYWADKIGITKEALMQRLVGGWTVAEAVTTPRYNRARKRVRRQLARVICDDQPQIQTSPEIATPSPLHELTRHNLAVQRQFNSVLRQFNRDLHALMGRSLDRGVVADLLKSASDRSTPVARDLP